MTNAEKERLKKILEMDGMPESVRRELDAAINEAADEVTTEAVEEIAAERDKLAGELDEMRGKFEDMRAKYIKRIVTPAGERIVYERDEDEDEDAGKPEKIKIFDEKEIVR